LELSFYTCHESNTKTICALLRNIPNTLENITIADDAHVYVNGGLHDKLLALSNVLSSIGHVQLRNLCLKNLLPALDIDQTIEMDTLNDIMQRHLNCKHITITDCIIYDTTLVQLMRLCDEITCDIYQFRTPYYKMEKSGICLRHLHTDVTTLQVYLIEDVLSCDCVSLELKVRLYEELSARCQRLIVDMRMLAQHIPLDYRTTEQRALLMY